MATALNKTEVCRELAASTGLGAQAIKHVLDDLAELAGDELEAGNDFIVPGICKVGYAYTAPKKKGERWLKGSVKVNNFTGEESIAPTDSPVVKAKIRMKLSPLGVARRLKPGTKPEVQAAFLKTTAGKAVARRAK